MAEQTVETTATEPQQTASTPVPATPQPDVEARVKAAVEQTRREAQAAKDREIAELHRRYQQQNKTIRQTAVARLRQVGDDEAERWDEDLDLRQKASQYDAIQQQASAWEAWNAHAREVAEAHGLAPDDARLANAADAADLARKAKAAMAEDAKKERERLKLEAEAAEQKRLQGKVDSGDLDSLSGNPAPPARPDLMAEYKKKLAAVAGNVKAVTDLKIEYRKKGLNVW